MPTVFLSSPANVDPDVVNLIQEVLREFDEVFEVKYWRDESVSGDIKQQMRHAMVACEFGVCYLSESMEAKGAGPRFVDNSNVIFEAGMLQAVHEMGNAGATGSSWIPIRECEPFAEPVPFNFATDRVVEVPRDRETGKLQKKEFKDVLRRSVVAEIERRELK